MKAVRSVFTRVNGLVTHARVRGAGPPVVIVPGLGCAAFLYDRLAKRLAPFHQVWAYDPPGHGRSGGRPGEVVTIAGLTDHLAAWMSACGLTGVPVIGHSLGGEVAIDLAARYPERASRLILLAPTGVPENPVPALQVARVLQDAPLEPPALLWRILAAYARAGLIRMARIAADQRCHLTLPELSEVGVPVLVLDGERDPVIAREAIATLCRRLPDARSARVPGAHAFHFASPGPTAREILDFLDSPDPQAHDPQELGKTLPTPLTNPFAQITPMTDFKVSKDQAPRGSQGEVQLVRGESLSLRLWDGEAPSGEKADHSHPYETVGYVISGEATLVVSGVRVMLEPGDSYHVPKNARHHYEIGTTFTAVEATSTEA